MKRHLVLVPVSCATDSSAAHARRWRAARTLYQTHAAWHEASRLDARRFETLVKFFAGLRGDGYGPSMSRAAA